MHSILKEIIRQKQKEVADLKEKTFDIEKAKKLLKLKKSFKNIFKQDELAIIGEIKRKSPSKGEINLIQAPLLLLSQYLDGGVSGISVLTDEKYFSGSIEDLIAIAEYLRQSKIPVLRKDFIIDEVQIDESVSIGANAILLIVSVLQEKTKNLLNYANELGMDAIVEVHTEEELTHAVEMGAKIIGINNRDLNTFKEDINVCLNLIRKMPQHIYAVAESAVKSPADIKRIKAAGFDGVLIGETLVKSDNPTALIREMRYIR